MKQQRDDTQQANGAKERRDVLWPIRWTASEIVEVKSLAESANAEPSAYVRGAALNKKPKPISRATGDRLALIKALGELGKIGSNVNQLAKSGNMGHPVLMATHIRALQAIEQCADAIRSQLQNPEP